MRGFEESDRRDFGLDALATLARASFELSWLLDRGYPRDTARGFVGDRYQLTARQRLFLARAVSGGEAACRRQEKRLAKSEIAGKHVLVDGFNAIVTLEVALSGGPVVACEDGTVRDLAGMRGTYHPCYQTARAIRLLVGYFREAGTGRVEFLIDAPVSNSGRLRGLIEHEAADSASSADLTDAPLVTARLERDVDAALSASCDVVVTSDSVILDRCLNWSNAVAEIVGELSDVWIVSAWAPHSIPRP